MKIKRFEKICKSLNVPLSRIKFFESLIKPLNANLYMVGGVVRDLLLLKKTLTPPDLVLDLPIKSIVSILKKNKIKFSSVGIEYGSIVVHDNLLKFDLTSMRKDLLSYGRHAKVKFSKSIVDDSWRRDFTINAIYCDTKGRIIDPQGGLKDLCALKKPKVRFIGLPEKRIFEDYLRILRFIRFSLTYSKKFNNLEFSICEKFKNELLKLSFERRISELERILILENFESKNVIEKISKFIELSLECKISPQKFLDLCRLERKLDKISFQRRIKFLLRKKKNNNLKFLNHVNKEFKERIKVNLKFNDYSIYGIFCLLYSYPKKFIIDFLFFAYVEKKISQSKLTRLLTNIDSFKKKKMPIDGNDLIKIGFRKGKLMGKILEKVKMKWIKKEFSLTKKECLSYASSLYPTGARR